MRKVSKKAENSYRQMKAETRRHMQAWNVRDSNWSWASYGSDYTLNQMRDVLELANREEENCKKMARLDARLGFGRDEEFEAERLMVIAVIQRTMKSWIDEKQERGALFGCIF